MIPCLLTLETIFTEVLRRGDMVVVVKPLKPKGTCKKVTAQNIDVIMIFSDESEDAQYGQWLRERYEETWALVLKCFEQQGGSIKQSDNIQAFATAIKLMIAEGKNPIEDKNFTIMFPVARLKGVLAQILSSTESNSHLVTRFQEFTAYHDFLFFAWKILVFMTPKGVNPNDVFIKNYLEIINSMPVTTWDDQKLIIVGEHENFSFDYLKVKKYINKCWNCVMHWQHNEATHKQVLVVLLERLLMHIEKPVLLTDFLMDSLDVGGPISLLALQGVFTLIQEHNLTYPYIYKKLYSMFEPEIFHTKYKARLFYLADLFLSSTHLPENLVAAFVKRLARLTLVAPPQDIIICLYFIGNLLIRHPGLKRLLHQPTSTEQFPRDPFIMDECEPTKSSALESSLWEVEALISHGLPTVSTAAKFITKPLPSIEYDLTQVLEINDSDVSFWFIIWSAEL